MGIFSMTEDVKNVLHHERLSKEVKIKNTHNSISILNNMSELNFQAFISQDGCCYRFNIFVEDIIGGNGWIWWVHFWQEWDDVLACCFSLTFPHYWQGQFYLWFSHKVTWRWWWNVKLCWDIGLWKDICFIVVCLFCLFVCFHNPKALP